MPEECGGVQGQAIFIDTEGSFNVSRLEGSVHICYSSINNTVFVEFLQSISMKFILYEVLFLSRYESGLCRTL
jgi:RecA/RadA recombinase